MPGNIKNFLDSFNENLTIAITKQEEKKNVFKTARDKAIKISDTRIGIWPSDASVKTIGDLFGYMFPASGSIKNEPQQLVSPAQPMMTPEYESHLEDRKSSDEIKKAYNDLDRSYRGFRYDLTVLKNKGGAQFWFDYLMYYALEFYLKDTTFTDKVKKASLSTNSDIYGLIPGDGKATADYSTPELFEDIIWNNSEYNSYQGLRDFVTNDLSADGLLYLAFVEAGENYSGTYTAEITTSKKSLFEVLDLSEEPKPKTVTPTGPSASGPSASGPSASGPSASEPISSSASTATGVTASGLLKPTFEGIQDGFQISAKTDMPSFSIYVGDPKSWPKLGDGAEEELPEGGENFENIDGAEVMDEEYGEEVFKGAEEFGITIQEYKLQDVISSSQESSDSGVTEPGAPAVIAPVSSFDALLKLAGSCARELGKNPRVKWENLRQGYIKGVHGLCPQGTQAVLYAMTGVKAVGQLSGNADYFSFRDGGKSKFPSKYFNDKIKVGKDYWKSKSQWQVGDVIAVGYTDGKPYGHIQVWTGTNWMSDFKQNALQSSHVDWTTPALWRLNATGVEAVKKQMKSIS
jgi:hypothetical protein